MKDMHSMRVVPREIELIRPVPEYSQYSETGFFCASNEPGRSEPEAFASYPKDMTQTFTVWLICGECRISEAKNVVQS